MIRLHSKDKKLFSAKEIESWLAESSKLSVTDLETVLMGQMEVKWFSKFSECLPDSLAIKALEERAFDVKGFVRELRGNKVLTQLEQE